MLTLHHLTILAIIFPVLFILLIQQSSTQIPPNSVFIPQPSYYAYADYPDAFNAFTNEGITIDFLLTRLQTEREPKCI